MRDHAPVPPTPRLRLATSADVDIVGDLTVDAYITGGHLSAGSTYESTLRDVGSRLDHTIVATDDDQVIGAVTITPPGHPLTSFAQDDEWEIRFLAVRSGLWGHGAGRALMAAAHQRAAEHRATAIVLRVVETNERGRGLYTQLGYQPIADRDWAPPSTPPILLMAYRRLLDTMDS